MQDIRIVVPDSAACIFRLLNSPPCVVEYVARAIVALYDKANGREAQPLPPAPAEAAIPWAIVSDDVERQIEYALKERAAKSLGGSRSPKDSKGLHKTPQESLGVFKTPQDSASIRSGKVRKGKVSQDEITTQGGGTPRARGAHRCPLLGDFNDSTFFDPRNDPVQIAVEITGDGAPVHRKAFGALLKAVGDKPFRSLLNTYWHELNAGEVPEDITAALKARLRALEHAEAGD